MHEKLEVQNNFEKIPNMREELFHNAEQAIFDAEKILLEFPSKEILDTPPQIHRLRNFIQKTKNYIRLGIAISLCGLATHLGFAQEKTESLDVSVSQKKLNINTYENKNKHERTNMFVDSLRTKEWTEDVVNQFHNAGFLFELKDFEQAVDELKKLGFSCADFANADTVDVLVKPMQQGGITESISYRRSRVAMAQSLLENSYGKKDPIQEKMIQKGLIKAEEETQEQKEKKKEAKIIAFDVAIHEALVHAVTAQNLDLSKHPEIYTAFRGFFEGGTEFCAKTVTEHVFNYKMKDSDPEYDTYVKIFSAIADACGKENFLKLFKDMDVLQAREVVDKKLGEGTFDESFRNLSEETRGMLDATFSNLLLKIKDKK